MPCISTWLTIKLTAHMKIGSNVSRFWLVTRTTSKDWWRRTHSTRFLMTSSSHKSRPDCRNDTAVRHMLNFSLLTNSAVILELCSVIYLDQPEVTRSLPSYPKCDCVEREQCNPAINIKPAPGWVITNKAVWGTSLMPSPPLGLIKERVSRVKKFI